MDPLGQVSGGSLQIRAPLGKLWLLSSAYHRDHFDVWGDDWREQREKRGSGSDIARLGGALFDMRRTLEVEDDAVPAYCLMIAEKGALLIEHCSDQAGGDLWTRVGVVEFFTQDEKWLIGFREKTLTIY